MEQFITFIYMRLVYFLMNIFFSVAFVTQIPALL